MRRFYQPVRGQSIRWGQPIERAFKFSAHSSLVSTRGRCHTSNFKHKNKIEATKNKQKNTKRKTQAMDEGDESSGSEDLASPRPPPKQRRTGSQQPRRSPTRSINRARVDSEASANAVGDTTTEDDDDEPVSTVHPTQSSSDIPSTKCESCAFNNMRTSSDCS